MTVEEATILAKNGNVEAMMYLGSYNSEYPGKAAEWYEMAAKAGNTIAADWMTRFCGISAKMKELAHTISSSESVDGWNEVFKWCQYENELIESQSSEYDKIDYMDFLSRYNEARWKLALGYYFQKDEKSALPLVQHYNDIRSQLIYVNIILSDRIDQIDDYTFELLKVLVEDLEYARSEKDQFEETVYIEAALGLALLYEAHDNNVQNSIRVLKFVRDSVQDKNYLISHINGVIEGYENRSSQSSDNSRMITNTITHQTTFRFNKKVVCRVVIGLLIIGLGFGGYFYVYPNVAFKNAVAKKDYQKISELYYTHSYRIKNATEQIDLLVDELIALYMEEKITEEEFSEMYVLQYARLGKIVEEARAKTDVLRQSHAALEEGKNYIENSNYENAISCLDKVDISDKCYDESQKLLVECKDKHVSIIIADMKKAASEKVWKSAIRLCDKGSALDANAYDWKQSREQYIDELLNEAITKIEEKLNEGDVKQADEIVDDYSHYLYEEEKFIKIQQRVSGLIGS